LNDSGQFRRDLPLQKEIECDNIAAVFKNGDIKIHLPKIQDGTQKQKISNKKN
jgi:HSP20 family molecular chaperone IbpA